MKARYSPKIPWYVLDWNVIERMPVRGHDWFKGRTCLVSEALATELVSKADARARAMARKFQAWIIAGGAEIYIAQNIFWLFRNEFRHDRSTKHGDLIDPLSTQSWRNRDGLQRVDLASRMEFVRDNSRAAPMERIRNRWVASCEAFAEDLKTAWESDQELRQEIESEESMQLLFRAFQAGGFYARFGAESYTALYRKTWTPLINRHPMRYAIGRWGRILLYYATRRLKGEKKKFDNNFDDAQYLFLASYTGHLVTSDQGLIRAARVCFPSLKVSNPYGMD